MSLTPLRILIALQYYVPHRTGLTLHVQRLAESLVRRGHSVTVLTARYNTELPSDEIVNGVRVVRLWAPIRVSRGMIMPTYPIAAYRLIREHDVVSIHSPLLETALMALVVRILGKGLVITHHGDLILPGNWKDRFVMWAVHSMFRVAGATANSLIAYSDDYAQNSYYLEPFLNKTTAVYPPIVVERPDKKKVQQLRATWLNGSKRGLIVGYAGRFVEEKRPDVLIRSLPVLREKYPDAKIVFAGEYDISYENFFQRHKALVDEFKDSLIFLGLLTDEEAVANFYCACDVLALPSDTECFALVQVEAMLCGTPVVATNIPGAREVVTVTGMGELAPPRDPHALGKAIAKVAANRSRYVKSYRKIAGTFRLDATIDAYEQQFMAANLSRLQVS